MKKAVIAWSYSSLREGNSHKTAPNVKTMANKLIMASNRYSPFAATRTHSQMIDNPKASETDNSL
ncbi:hypothetical protein QKW52_14590 [Bacillus sonorensis]|nr:hypothetical protein [Bacillus sonorensis]